MTRSLRERIFSVTPGDFEPVALEVFRFQAESCAPYREYLGWLGVDPAAVTRLEDIPSLPVEMFRSRIVYAGSAAGKPDPGQADVVFTSSGTTGAETSRHYVADVSLYRDSFTRGFSYFYGGAGEYSVFALLPSYLERTGSSLVYMAEHLQALNRKRGGFFLYEYPQLCSALGKAAQNGEKVLLIGVAFALLDFAEYLLAGPGPLRLPAEAIVMETGGMKGRRREIVREEMHTLLQKAFGVDRIHSEYGMTELLSQAYSDGEGVFRCPPWMSVRIRDLQNPLRTLSPGENGAVSGGIDMIDLANLYSCSFIAVQDRGELMPDGSFRVSGRIEGAQLRGCNMLVE